MLSLTLSPASFAAAMPCSTCPSRSRRLSVSNSAESIVSSETLIRFTPAAARSSANWRKLRAVGGQRELLEPVTQLAAERVNQLDHVAPHQWLAARQADLADPAVDHRQRKLVQLFEAEHVLARRGTASSRACSTSSAGRNGRSPTAADS